MKINVSTVYAVGESGRLVGAIALGDLIVARAGDRLSDVIDADCPALPASGPFITTLNDLVAVLAYYGLAYLLLL